MAQKVPSLRNIDSPIPLRKMAFQTIKEAILTDQLKSGFLYSEPDLARELNISRTPVHEALIELASIGFVKFLPRKGFQIKELKEKEIRKLYAFRKALEIAVIQDITDKVTDELISELNAIINKQNQTILNQDLNSFIQADREFHFFLAAQTENNYIISALKNVRDLIDWFGTKILIKQKDSSRQAINEHIVIIEMLKEKSKSGASSKMEEHLNLSENRILNLVSRQKLTVK